MASYNFIKEGIYLALISTDPTAENAYNFQGVDVFSAPYVQNINDFIF
jgi:hypothetical protein